MGSKKEVEEKMQGALSHLEGELKNLRTGRANPAMLDGVMVEVYGAQMQLNTIANVSCPESRQLVVTPFDMQNCAAIGKAIEKADLGVNPIVEGDKVRLNIPPMDGTMREKMQKTCRELCESAKVTIRQARKDGNEYARKEHKDGNTTEDDLKRTEKDIQEMTDKYCLKCDETAKKKEGEIATV